MSQDSHSLPDAWHSLRSLTSARIALGRAGGSLPTREWLDFRLCHAAARDAVHEPFGAEKIAQQLQSITGPCQIVSSEAHNRSLYLRRPDLGRRLSSNDQNVFAGIDQKPDVALIVTDGLSATAVHANIVALFKSLLPKLDAQAITCRPVVIVKFGRVGIQDPIGEMLGAKASVIFIGERPGLSSPDSLGAYLVYNPRRGNTDVHRNCISNIRKTGLSCEAASQTIAYLLTQSLKRKISGVDLKDDRSLRMIQSQSGPVPK